MTKIFVYGTLMSKGGANHMLQSEGAAATTYAEYDLLDLGWFPGLVKGQCCVEGEVYDVAPDILERLDVYEGVAGGLYVRDKLIVLMDESLKEVEVEAYFYNRGGKGTPNSPKIAVTEEWDPEEKWTVKKWRIG